MQPFLKSIAEAYTRRYDDLSEFCFLFPNKRSGTFFLNYLKGYAAERPLIAPEVMSITDFVMNVSGLVVDSRIDLLFRAYRVYTRLVSEEGGKTGLGKLDFKSFRAWGETALSDFSEIEQYCCDPEEIFKNLKDYKEIATDYLTDEQRRVMEEYFGQKQEMKVGNFWRNFKADGDDLSKIKSSFLHIWEVMTPMFTNLKEWLERDGLCMQGTAYRRTLELLRDGYKLPYKKIVCVGFNALSTSERLIFEELRDYDDPERDNTDTFCDFFWDGTGPVLKDDNNSATRFLRINRRRFPSPEWARKYLDKCETESLPEIKMIASPSNVTQVKIAGREAAGYRALLGAEGVKAARMAIVLPDENLLLPLLYSIPSEMGDINLTMGYSLRLTSTASFVSLLRAMHARRGRKDGRPAFYNETLRALLAHPFSRILLGSREVERINGYLSRHNFLWVSVDELISIAPEGKTLFMALDSETSVENVTEYLDRVLDAIYVRLGDGERELVKSRLDRSHIELYKDGLARLRNSVEEHGVKIDYSDVFLLLDRLLSGETVRFEGEPLRGLQVMGSLETRSIDFDYLIIPSANEGTLPKKMRKRTFIPNTLRYGYGLPAANYEESIFSYYFYRMISRAKAVTLIYDAHTGEVRAGEMSRYLQQLQYLYAENKMKIENHSFRLTAETGTKDMGVEKSDAVMEKLAKYKEEGSGKNLSASAFKKYGDCPAKFYFEVVEGFSDEPEPQKYISALELGNIVHDTMMRLYLPKRLRQKYLENPVVITEAHIRKYLDDENELMRKITRSVNREHFHYGDDRLDTPLEGPILVTAREVVMHHVRNVLQNDLKHAPFRLYGCEVKGNMRWKPTEDSDYLNVTFVIDRLDEVKIGGEERMRIVDYKTGRAKNDRFEDEESLVRGGAGSSSSAFQLILYANLLSEYLKKPDLGLSLCIYETSRRDKMESYATKREGKIDDYRAIREEFCKSMSAFAGEIFDPETRFEMRVLGDDDQVCKYCQLKAICGR